MKSKRKAFLCAMMLFSSVLISGQTEEKFDSLVTLGIDQIYSINFDEAQSTFQEVISIYPNRPSGYFFDAMIVWWKILLDLENEEYDDVFYDKLEGVIEFCDKILERDPENVESIFFKGGSLGFRGRLLAVRESWLNAALDGKDALPLVHKAYALDKNNIDVQLGFGIYNYYAAVIPEKFSFVKPVMIFFPKGDKIKGLEELKNTAKNGKYAKYESNYFLMTLYYSFEEDYAEAAKYAEYLWKTFPDNPKFQLFLGRTWVRRNNYAKAYEIFKDVLRKHEAGKMGYHEKAKREASYYVGVHFKNQRKLNEAINYFRICSNACKSLGTESSGFNVNSILYLGNIYDLKGDRNRAIQLYKKVLSLNEFNSSHTQANRYLKTPYR